MLIFDDKNRPIVIDNITNPIVTSHLWVLDLNLMDFTLAPLQVVEEVVCPSIQLNMRGYEFLLPAFWNILIYDRETSQLDVVDVAEVAGRDFTAFVCGPNKFRPEPVTIDATDYVLEHINTGPMLNKHQMLCHPISNTDWIVVSGNDTYKKYIKNRCIGDLLV